MNDIEHGVAQDFLLNLDTIASDLVRCFGLKHEQETGNLNNPLLRWLDFRLRYIDPKPRKVLLSNRFPKRVPQSFNHALTYLIHLIERGENINPYQGKGLVLHHDISGSRRQNRTDLLWADWGIIHLHLTEAPISQKEYFSERSEWILFGIPGDDFFAVIDIRNHDEENIFSNPELMEIILESWPEMMKRFEIKGLAAPKKVDMLGAKEHATLRKSGVSSLITIKGKLYAAPGMGISTASTPVRVTFAKDTAREYVRTLASEICIDEGEFQAEVRAEGIQEPCFSLCITPRGMAVYELHVRKAWLLPREKVGSESNYLAKLQNLVAPEWVTERLFSSEVTSNK